MIDKIATVHRSQLGQRIGEVSTTEMLQLERGLLVYLGMTVGRRTGCGGLRTNQVQTLDLHRLVEAR